MGFKVKTKERRELTRALQREIKTLGLVDTWAMYDGVRVTAKASESQLNVLNLTVVAPYYYLFQDKGTGSRAEGDKGSKNSKKLGLPAKAITEKWTKKPAFKKTVTTIMQQYIDYTIENYPILDVGKILTDPAILIGFAFYGDPTGEWNIDIAPTRY